MKKYPYITEETQSLFLNDLKHACDVLGPQLHWYDFAIVNAHTGRLEQMPHVMFIKHLYRICSDHYYTEFEYLCSHPFFHFPQYSDHLTTLAESFDFSNNKRFFLKQIIHTTLLDAALLTCFNVLFQIIASDRLRLTACNRLIKQAKSYSTIAAVYNPATDNIAKQPSTFACSAKSQKNMSSGDCEFQHHLYESEIRNPNDQAKRFREVMKSHPLLQQLFSITSDAENGKPQQQTDKNQHTRSPLMQLPLSQYLIFNRILSMDLRCIKTVLKIYSNNAPKNNEKAKIRMKRGNNSTDIIQYKLGYFSLGNRAFDEILLSDNLPYMPKTTAKDKDKNEDKDDDKDEDKDDDKDEDKKDKDDDKVLFQDELLIYQTMESTFHCELTEMMAKKYDEIQTKYAWLKESDLLSASFFGIFNNLPNYLTRSIFVNYSFLTLERICKDEDKSKRERAINTWKENCTSFVSEISDHLFPKILWHMLINLFYISDPDFMPSNPNMDYDKLRITFTEILKYLNKEHITNILAPLQKYSKLYDNPCDHQGNELPQSFRDHATQIKIVIDSLCLSDSSKEEAPLHLYQSIIQATDLSRSQQLLPSLS